MRGRTPEREIDPRSIAHALSLDNYALADRGERAEGAARERNARHIYHPLVSLDIMETT